MKQIPLTQGKFALVDDEDYEWLMRWKWCADKHDNTFYAMRKSTIEKGKYRTIYMHREVLGLKHGDGKITDHFDNHGLHNTKDNLRTCSSKENSHNRRSFRVKSSKYKGLWWWKKRNKWMVQIRINGKKKNLGYYDSELAAAKAYDKAALKFHGEYANLNFPKEVKTCQKKNQ